MLIQPTNHLWKIDSLEHVKIWGHNMLTEVKPLLRNPRLLSGPLSRLVIA